MSPAAKLATLALAIAGLWVAPAQAQLAFAPVNTPGAPDAPAFSGIDPASGELVLSTKAIWAGACDLGSAATTGGGVGSHNGGVEPPALRVHCLDMGPGGAVANAPWEPGTAPRWRLAPVAQAGAHPDVSAAFYFARNAAAQSDGTVKDIIVKLPPGVVGNPEALVKCPALAAQAVPADCPASAQAGVGTLNFGQPHNTHRSEVKDQTRPVYAIEARDTVTAEFTIGNVSTLFNVPITARGRTNSDYGVDTLALLIPEYVPLVGQSFTFWGVPWAAEHDKFRIDGRDAGAAGDKTEPDGDDYFQKGVKPEYRRPYDAGHPDWQDAAGNPLAIRPFFANPTECSGERLPVQVLMDSWQEPVSRGGSFVAAEVLTDVLDGCEELEFDPAITLRPTVAVSDSPSGLEVKLEVPQNNDPPAEALGNPNLPFDPSDDTGAPAYWKTPAGRASAHLKDTTVALPAGTSFNPAAANGLHGCTTAQIGLTATHPKVTFNNDPVRCPQESKMGTLKIDSPLLPDPLFGEVYAAPQHDNPFPGALTAIYMVAQDEERGLSIKLPGKVDLDPTTGQISTTFVDNPQLPFESFELSFKSGPRAPLNTPPVCGQFRNQVSLIPWSFPHSGPAPAIQDPFDISQAPNNQPCVTEPQDRLFTPGFNASSLNGQAKAHTSFAMNVTRIDGQQEFSSLAVQMPPGLTANLTETPYCPEHLIEAAKHRSGTEETHNPSCPAASRMGSVVAMAGAGPLPLPNTGTLYIAGPYDPDGPGPRPLAPFSVVVIAPAIAGGTPQQPAFDLGNVVIRSAGYVDPRTAQVQIASTPVPYIVGGVPLRIRAIQVAIEKPNFMLNPTNCAPMAVGAQIGGAADPLDPTDDIAVPAHSPFQVGNCAALGFKPKLNLRLFGKPRRGAYQRLRAVLRTRPGDANIRRTAVTLPPSAFLAQENLRTICTRVQWAQGTCPKGSIVGHARAFTPLLREPLQGPVYLRSSDNPLPDIVAHLRGQFDVELVGKIDSVPRKGEGAGIRSTFDVVPDAPVERFVLNMFGGKRSLIVNSRNICLNPGRANLSMRAHNGRRHRERLRVANSCTRKQVKRAKGAKRGRGKNTAKGRGGKR